MKRSKFKKKVKNDFKDYEKNKRKATFELEELIQVFLDKYHSLDREIVYNKLLSWLKVKEKNNSYIGARLFPIILLNGVVLYIITTTLLDISNPDSLVSFSSEMIKMIEENIPNLIHKLLLHTQIFGLSIVIIFPLLFLSVGIGLIYDSYHRKRMFQNNLMIEILQEKIDNLKKTN